MSPIKKAAKSAPSKRRSVAPSLPEVKVGYAVAGRDTLAAIDEELARPAPPAEPPLIEISEAPAGRETLAAITEELGEAARPRQNTLPYGDRISNAPGSLSPSRAPAPAPRPSSRRARVTPPPAPPATTKPVAVAPAPTALPDAIEIFELVTFIVRGNVAGDLSTDAQRRRFVESHLLKRVPGGSMEGVERVEVTPWTAKGTMVVRVWCRA